MHPALFFDAETTGKVYFRAPKTDAAQGRLVQVAALLVDLDDGREMARYHSLVKPYGWSIPAEATAIHGITIEDCRAFGVPVLVALVMMNALADRANIVVAHNVEFDDFVLDGECMRLPYGMRFAPDRERFCTMKAATPLCKLPGKFGNYKWPKLAEAHSVLCGAELVGAHDAMKDVEGCLRVFKAIKGLS